MMRRGYVRQWERFARSDPYFAVLADERYRLRHLDPAARQDFFASGFQYVEFLFDCIRTHFDSRFQPSDVVDFGCGVGRVAVALSERSQQVVAVDVSRQMLEEARKNCSSFGAANVEFKELSAFLRETPAPADLVNAYIVFQHIPVHEGEELCRSLIALVRPGGFAAMHFVFKRSAPAWRKLLSKVRATVPGAHLVANLLQRKPPEDPHMQMNSYDLNRVFALLQANGYGHSYSVFTDHGGYVGLLIIAQRVQRQVP